MVVAGIFMVGRLYGVFFQGLSIGTSSVNLLAVVGAVTVIGGAGLAFVQNDIKKVLAYSTVSQLGYMVMALGVGAWTAAMFHLFTHAMFKAGLFLGSGSVAHSVHSFDMKEDMGGMKRFMPRTYWTFVICTAALIGLFPLAGFWSKDEILAGAEQLGTGYTAFLVVGLLGALMTAAYMTRCVYLTFHGEPRGHAADPDHPPHESGPRIVVPLYILTGLAIVAGFVNIPNTRRARVGSPTVSRCASSTTSSRRATTSRAPSRPSPTPSSTSGSRSSPPAIGLTGIGLAYAWYFRGLGPHGITERNKAGPHRPPGPGEQVLLRLALHRRHRPGHQGPDRPGRLLVQPERPRRRRQRRRVVVGAGGPVRLRHRSTRASSTPSSTAPAPPPRAAARASAGCRPGACSSTPPCSSPPPPSSPAC